MSKFKIFSKSIIIPVLVGGIVGIIISKFMDYDTLIKPRFSPPGIAFPIVWTILYILMGVSYGILESKNLIKDKIDSIYYWQLFVNALWPIAFFVFKWRFFAFLWIILLAILVAIMLKRFYDENKTAGLLQIPYLIWTLFATYLNLGVWLLNRG